jgi:hypothetical protein
MQSGHLLEKKKTIRVLQAQKPLLPLLVMTISRRTKSMTSGRAVVLGIIICGICGLSFPVAASNAYKYKVIAWTGQTDSLGRTLIGIGGSPTNNDKGYVTINDNGVVAFVGRVRKTFGQTERIVQNIYAFHPNSGAPYPLMPTAFELPEDGDLPTQTFSPPQINNSNQVLSRRRMDPIVTVLFLLPPGIPFTLTLYPPLTYLEAWDATAPQSLPTLVMGADPGLGAVITSPFVFLVIYNPIWGGIYPSPFIPNVPWDAFHSPRNESFPSHNNRGDTVFAALDEGQHYLATLITPPKNAYKTDEPRRVRIADDGSIVFEDSGRILLANYDLTSVEGIAGSSNGFVSVGKSPGISDDGKVVVFYGDLSPAGASAYGTTHGPGIFAAVRKDSLFLRYFTDCRTIIPIDDFGSLFQIVRVSGLSAELGYPEVRLGSPIQTINFKPDGYVPDSRISVIHHDLGESGLVGDSFIVSFIATPSTPSRLNPATGERFFFTGEKGLWTVRIDIERRLSPLPFPDSHIPIYYCQTMPQPVVQIGDVISGRRITNIGVYDSISDAKTDEIGNPRPVPPRRWDHRVVFWADTDAGQMIVRASHLDSDEDNLPDHWEVDGLDMDGDGVKDLDLPAMGADPFKRDLFVEIDWLVPRNDGGLNVPYSNEPAPGVTKALIDMFAKAPALPNGIPAGINLHVDAGHGRDRSGEFLSQNMGMDTAKLRGGNLIGQVGSNAHLDVVHMGLPGKINVPGVEARSFHDIKEQYCLKADKGSRELVFHYVVMADFLDVINEVFPVVNATGLTLDVGADQFSDSNGNIFDLRGRVIKITTGPGAGQLRTIRSNTARELTVDYPWASLPQPVLSRFVIFDDTLGIGEFFYPGALIFRLNDDFPTVPGNDALIILRSWIIPDDPRIQFRTLAHELGHTLGLKHGGFDHIVYKPDYFSLMNYRALFEKPPTTGVESYSDATDPVFDDWGHLKLDFRATSILLGNSYWRDFSGRPLPEIPEPRMNDFIIINGGFPNTVKDVTSQISITFSGFRYNRATKRYVQTVALKNISDSNITGPVSLVLDNLSSNASLFNRTGFTNAFPPGGSPYINVNVGFDNTLTPSESANVILEFTNPTNQGITYKTRVLAGHGER